MPDYLCTSESFVPPTSVCPDGSVAFNPATITVPSAADAITAILGLFTPTLAPGQPTSQPGVVSIYAAVTGQLVFAGQLPAQVTPESVPVVALAAHVASATPAV